MAGAKPGVHALQLKPVSVHEALKKGGKFIKWEEDTSQNVPDRQITLNVDADGFFLYWSVSPNQELEILDISLIRDTRTGKYAKQPKQKTLDLIPSRDENDNLLTIVYGTDLVNVTFYNFVALELNVAKLWVDQLFEMATNKLSQNASRTTYLRKAYTKLTLQAIDGKIPLKNIYKMFSDRKRVDYALDKKHVTAINLEEFTWDFFTGFLDKACGRPELQTILEESGSRNKPFITLDQFTTFLNTKQRDPRLNEVLYPPLKKEQVRQIMENYESPSHLDRDQISLKAFSNYLAGEENNIVPPEKLDLMDDMNQPLSNYFINSSHNTYLTVGQLTGMSSVEMYRQVLLTGCRCIELDCWKGRLPDEEPYITHGFTMTTEISFKEVLEAIAESAFKTSNYPVILSFENHVDSPTQQAKMAEYCKTIFGDALLINPLEKFPLVPEQPLPSPQDLLGKILVKNKKKPDLSVKSLEEAGLKELEPESEEEDTEETAAEMNKPYSDEGTAYREVIATKEMSTLVNYIQPVKFKSFNDAAKKKRLYEMSSFVETKAMDLLKNFPCEFLEYNKKQLSRIYPKGTRVDSSNYMPQLFWNIGCQMVALNFQTPDLPMQLNMGVFEYNGRSGYLLKPEVMRRTDRQFDPFTDSIVDGIVANAFRITVISGQFLSERKVGVIVEVDMFGLPGDAKKRAKTKMSNGNSMDPVWKNEKFFFPQVILPSLASVRISAYEENGRFIGHRVLPVSAIRPGFHYICLKNELNQPLMLPSLLVLTEVWDYIPTEHQKYADALADPIRYVSQFDKRQKQLEALMAYETEMMDVPDSPPTPDPRPAPKPKEEIINNNRTSEPGPSSTPKDKDFVSTVITKLILPSVKELKEQKSYDKLQKKQLKEFKDLSKKNQKKLQSEIQKKCSLIEKKFKRSIKKHEPQESGLSAQNQTVVLQEEQMQELLKLQQELHKQEEKMRLEHLKEAYKKLQDLAEDCKSNHMKKMKDTCEREKKEIQKMMDRKRQNSISEVKVKDNKPDEEINEINSRHIKETVSAIRTLEEEQDKRSEKLKQDLQGVLESLNKEFEENQKKLEQELDEEYQQLTVKVALCLQAELHNKGVRNESLSNHSSPGSASLSNCSTPTFPSHRRSTNKILDKSSSPSVLSETD
ncbi:1-phosphatidylinositol 4,5-bisphosphate phosphodiesterase beta-3 [Nothobranchius furzeri]|uniref:1-phosphatidylinositol 4,5-bisphosphate phosphodiesterase n=1 Tax=Nothobranchius furzeri TaxID=105023 RepID=A0A1A7ZIA7_NOTFU|nr:phospholipase C beta 3 [Nothobranchius furzeri]